MDRAGRVGLVVVLVADLFARQDAGFDHAVEFALDGCDTHAGPAQDFLEIEAAIRLAVQRGQQATPLGGREQAVCHGFG